MKFSFTIEANQHADKHLLDAYQNGLPVNKKSIAKETLP